MSCHARAIMSVHWDCDVVSGISWNLEVCPYGLTFHKHGRLDLGDFMTDPQWPWWPHLTQWTWALILDDLNDLSYPGELDEWMNELILHCDTATEGCVFEWLFRAFARGQPGNLFDIAAQPILEYRWIDSYTQLSLRTQFKVATVYSIHTQSLSKWMWCIEHHWHDDYVSFMFHLCVTPHSHS